MYVSDLILIAGIAYLLGSIPFGIVLAKLFGLPDPRTIGSKNIGATNMLRTGNKKVALLTLLFDAGKGALAVWLTYQHFGTWLVRECIGAYNCVPEELIIHPAYAPLALLCAALGHMFSPWLKFSGGKGVATILGGLITLSYPLALVFCGVFLVIFIPTRYVSLASLIALVAVPVAAGITLGLLPAAILATASGVAFYKHRANIARLRAGTESKTGGKKHA